MNSLIATAVFGVVVLVLFWLDRDRKHRTSLALWIPVTWLFISSSRNVSEWFHGGFGNTGNASDLYLEGSPLDRDILTFILALGVIILLARWRKVRTILRANLALILFFVYCLVSVLWSDFPDVSLKRWFRALGDVVMVLVVLSETDRMASIRRFLVRAAFVLAPLSILLIRYFPELGRSYSRSTGRAFWVGVATDKNALGMLCLVFGLAAIFYFLELWKEEKRTRKSGSLIAMGVLILMTLYLLRAADSATAFACFGLAAPLMVLTYLFRFARKPVVVHFMTAALVTVAFSVLFLGVGSELLTGLGRESTLTGRTNIWHFALGMVKNPLFGTGFESFWVGRRLEEMMRLIDQSVNQAHNGYIEVYLNLGYLGVAALAALLFTGYRRIVSAVSEQAQAGSLRLAFFVTAVTYSFTEAGFKTMNPVWIVFLLAVAIVPKRPAPAGGNQARRVKPQAELENSEFNAGQQPDPFDKEVPEMVRLLEGKRIFG